MWLNTVLAWLGSWFVGEEAEPVEVETPAARTAYSIAQDRVSEAPSRTAG